VSVPDARVHLARARWLVPSAILATLALFVVGPLEWRCPLRALAGIPCPTCGMTRATSLVLRGDFAGATALHPLVWLVVPVIAAFVLVEAAGYARTRTWATYRRVPGMRAVMLATAAALFVVWVARFFGAFGGPAT